MNATAPLLPLRFIVDLECCCCHGHWISSAGAVETTFEPTGLICKLSVVLTEDSQSIVPHETRQEARRVINKKRC